MLLNWYKYNLNISRNTLVCINRELQYVKNKEFVRRFYELCKSKRYPLNIIFSGIDMGDTIKANEIKDEVKEKSSEGSKEVSMTTFGDVVTHFNENIHLMSPLELQNIRDWCERLSEDIVIMAISEAVRNNGRNLKYIDGILINWHREGLRTAEGVKGYLKDWKKTGWKRQKEPENIQNADAYRIIENPD